MKEKEIIIKEYIAGEITRKQASIKLGVTERTVVNIKNRFLKEGAGAFVHKNTGKTPVNKTNKEIEKKVICLYEKYSGFNFTHFLEENHKCIRLSDKTITRILNSGKYYSPKSHSKKKKEIIHPLRPRKKYFGELIQMDASSLDWLNISKKFHLHLAIDDATNTIVAGYFGLQETTSGYIKCLYQILNNYGIPKCFYTDNRTTFNIKRAGKSIDANIQFKRICKNFGTEIKTTSVPQAKGRVERYNGVLQDRLANELRFNKIKTIKEANKYLNEIYIKKHNNNFSIPTNKYKTVFKKLELSPIELNIQLSLQYDRKMLSGNVISVKDCLYKAYDRKNKEVKFNYSEKVKLIIALNGQFYIKRELNNKLYLLKLFSKKTNTLSHPTSINHPWKNPNNYGKPIKEQIW